MAYTKTCSDCPAKITWDDTNKRYVDEIFKNQKHNHDTYKAAIAYLEEQGHESFTPPAQDAKQKPKENEGSICFVCKKNGFPDEIIFFNDEMKGSKTGKHIPLERPDKVNGEYVTHEHKKPGDTNVQAPQNDATVLDEPKKESATTAVPSEGVEFGQMALNDTIRAFTHQLDTQQKWFEDTRDKIDTILAYVLDHTVKKADEQ